MKGTALLATVGLVAMTNIFAAQQCVLAQGSQSNPFHSNPFHSGTNPFHQSNPFHSNHFPKDGPFVVAAVCSGETGNSVTYIKSGLQVRAENIFAGSGDTFAGWEVFNSHPGVNPGNIMPTLSSVAPAGTYSFTVSGLPSNAEIQIVDVDTSGHYNENVVDGGAPVSNGLVSLVAPAPKDSGETLCAVYFWIFTPTGSSPLGTYTVKNFKLDGKAMGIDTTHQDSNGNTDFAWCNSF
jgi:hypothetical protein